MEIGPKLNTNNLIFCIDPLNLKSYSGSGTDIREISGISGGQVSVNSLSESLLTREKMGFNSSTQYLRFERDDINAGSFSYDYISFYVWMKTPTTGYTTNNTNCNIITIEDVFEVSIGDNSNGYGSLKYAGRPWAWRGNDGDVFENGVWNLITFVHGASNDYLYVNGINKHTQSNGGALLSGNSTYPWLTVGGRFSGTSSPFTGDLSLMHLYSVEHSPEQVLNFYNRTKSRFNL